MGYVSLTHSTVTRQIFGRGVVSMVTSVLFLGFLLLTLIGVPIAIALGCASLFVVLLLPHLNIELLVQGLVSGLDSFPLLAVLLFTLMGNVMSKCGISDKLLRLAEVFLANMKGGLGIVAVISCLIFGSISGTGSSTVAAIGMSMIPKMIESGYKPSFSGSLIASTGGLGVIIPPSVIMIIYAVSAQVSIIKLFSAGIIPGLLIALFLMIYCVYTARKEGIEGSHKVYTAQDKMEAIKGAILPLGLPVSILGGIYSGWFTPAESAAMGVLYCLILSGVVYRTLTFKKLCDLLVESCLLVSTVLIILAASVCFGRIMAIEEVPTQIADFILSVSETPWVILLGIN